MKKREITYEITTEYEGMKISRFLFDKKYPKVALTRLRHSQGAIILNGQVVHMNELLHERDQLCVIIDEPVERTDKVTRQTAAGFPKWDILYEDEDILVINKPPFLPIHPTRNHQGDSLADAVLGYCLEKKEPIVFRCINRLDRDTSGLTLVAKHYLAAGILSQQMMERRIKREYTALVTKEIDSKEDETLSVYRRELHVGEEGVIELPIARKEEGAIMREVDFARGEHAVTHYRVDGFFRVMSSKMTQPLDVYRVVCVLETGRTHQIRVHMKAIGYPLLGDFLYNPSNHTTERQALHAGKLSFVHPITGATMEFLAPPPQDFWGRG